MTKSTSRLALGALLMLGGALAAVPADAKKAPPPPPAAPTVHQLTLSKEERAALVPIQTAITAKDWAAASAALPAAQAAAQGPDAKYTLGQFMLQIGIGTNSDAVQAQAVNMMISSGAAPASNLVPLYSSQGALGVRLRNYQVAEAGFAKVVELTPNDPNALINLAKVEGDLRKPGEAIALIDRAIQAKRAAGQPIEENWYKYALKLAYDNRLAAPSLKVSRDLIAAYPTKENWRDALLIYRDLHTLDKGTNIDLMRLMRASKALAGERDWFELAQELDMTGLPGEGKAVLEEGVSLHMIDLTKGSFRDLMRAVSGRVAADRAALPGLETRAMGAATGTMALSTADAYYGYGDYAKAVPLYRAALSKGSVDANAANLHLGMTLAAMGNRAEAEAAFRAVTGARSEVASFWLTWLAQPHA